VTTSSTSSTNLEDISTLVTRASEVFVAIRDELLRLLCLLGSYHFTAEETRQFMSLLAPIPPPPIAASTSVGTNIPMASYDMALSYRRLLACLHVMCVDGQKNAPPCLHFDLNKTYVHIANHDLFFNVINGNIATEDMRVCRLGWMVVYGLLARDFLLQCGSVLIH